MSIIHDMRATATMYKSSVALSYENTEMTYNEFMLRVDGLAMALRKRYIGAGDRVAVALPRSFEMIIAIFGVLASGATYVPLDLSNPSSRLMTILEDAKAALLLSDIEGDELSISLGIPRLDPNEWPNQGPIADPAVVGIAYIIYTSGSTGKPKGVEVSHLALQYYLRWATTELPFTGGGVPLFTSISFDHALTNIFPPLLKGDKIVLLPPILGGRILASALLANHSSVNDRYSYVKITPSLFEFLDKEQRAQLGCHTHLLMFGGEKLSPSLIGDARRNNPELAILNHYGPTETTIGCCVYSIPLNFFRAEVPIGKTIPGVEASIRFADLSIVEAAEPGELFISGISLANGYWQKPDLTRTSFLNLSDAIYGEKRWYRTGDLARRSPNGEIEYLGRIDDQVKILGNRIELNEVLRHLNTFPKVKQSAVFSYDHGNSTELIAALTFAGAKPNEVDIKKHLQAFLPSVMIPTQYLLLDKLPIAASGKIDVKSLQSIISRHRHDLAIEEAISNKFQEILGVEQIGLEDDYFLLGGDSLGTVEIATWAGEEYNITLDIWCIFHFPTIATLSQHIREVMALNPLLT